MFTSSAFVPRITPSQCFPGVWNSRDSREQAGVSDLRTKSGLMLRDIPGWFIALAAAASKPCPFSSMAGLREPLGTFSFDTKPFA